MSGKEDTGAKAAQVKRSGEEKIRGVFSTQSVARVGTGTTQRKTIQKTFWFVEEKKAGVVSVQPLNKNYVPSGPKREVPKEDFLAKFSPEPEFYLSTVYPKMRELNETISRGEQARERGALYSAEFEFKNAAKVDDDNVKANFGLGLTYLERGETVKANDIFKRLVNLEASFDKEHKHLFNDFGINLRKNKMLEQALDYYLRAEKLVENDENLYHNIARAYYEKGDIEKCVQYLDKCLRLKPDMEEAVKFMEYLKKNGYVKDGEVRSEASGGSRGAGSVQAEG
ncbi:MAG: tetratricopeptide repeat protein, partial [Desulfovibrionaceae bacterium]|nr:tetratricopeptide repeat protein [Desulfovibrionaceae bacterium]